MSCSQDNVAICKRSYIKFTRLKVIFLKRSRFDDILEVFKQKNHRIEL